MASEAEVAIVGAGPYGLSLAAHLEARGVPFRIFGNPMQTWMNQMPEGMFLKSEGFASSLYDPDSAFTLGDFCNSRQIPYADTGLPVRLDTFTAYGLEFQKKFVPRLEAKQVVSLDRRDSGFRLQLSDGETVWARRVVIAAGISHFSYMPPNLAALPRELVSHTSAHRSMQKFSGKDVTVIGAGASALDAAALLTEAGASVQLVARKHVIRFHNPPGKLPRPLLDRLRAPMTGLGPGWRSLLCTNAPLVFHRMPGPFRLEVVRRHLGPAPAWFVKAAVEGHVQQHLGFDIRRLRIDGGRVHLQIEDGAGDSKWLASDHLIAGTGYRVDLRRFHFLSARIQRSLRALEYAPELSSTFESSEPGLYFIGAAAANSFGPLVRFAFGAGFTARRLSKVLAKGSRSPRYPVQHANVTVATS